MTSTMWRWLQK